MSTWDDVMTLNRVLTDAATRGDATALSALYDADARFVVAGSPTYRGADEMAQLCEAFLSSGPVDISYEPIDLWESGDLVVTLGSLVIGGGTKERCMVVYRRRPDGSLAILVDAPVRETAYESAVEPGPGGS
jgi:ketosteroid isomerase-like protein